MGSKKVMMKKNYAVIVLAGGLLTLATLFMSQTSKPAVPAQAKKTVVTTPAGLFSSKVPLWTIVAPE